MVRLVGRSDEFAAAVAVVERCIHGGVPGAVLLRGEPGIGKSALLAAIEAAVPPIATRIHATGYVTERDVAFAAAGPALRDLAGFGEAGRALSGIAASGAKPLQLLEAAYRAVSTRPVVVVADDVQWFDERSLALLHYLLRGAVAGPHPLVLLAASRPVPSGVAFVRSVAELLPDANAVRFILAPLPPAAVAELVGAVAPSLPAAEVARVSGRACGSPFWATMLARGIDERSVISDRLDALVGDDVEVFAAVVVAARPVADGDIASVLGWSEERVAAAAERSVAAGLLLRSRGQLVVVHDLVREAALQGLPADRLARLHGRFAAALAADGASATDLQVAIGHRRSAGMPATDLGARLLRSAQRRRLGSDALDMLVDELGAADAGTQRALGTLATELGSHDVAQERWLAASEREPDAARRAADLLAAARAAYLRRAYDDARNLLDDARAGADVVTEIEAALLEGGIVRWADHDAATARTFTARALERIEAADDGGDAWRAIRFGALVAAREDAMVVDDVPGLVRRAEELMPVAASLGPARRREAIAGLMDARIFEGRLQEALELADEVIAEARREALPAALLSGLAGRVMVLHSMGLLVEARELATEAVSLERRFSRPPSFISVESLAVTIDLSISDWSAAVRRLAAIEDAEPDPHFRLAPLQGQLLGVSAFGETRRDEVLELVARGHGYLAGVRCRRCGLEFACAAVGGLMRLGERGAAAATWEARPEPGDDPRLDLWSRRATALMRWPDDPAMSTSLLRDIAVEAEAHGWVLDAVWTLLDLGRAAVAGPPDVAAEILAAAGDLAGSCGAVNEAALAQRLLRSIGVRTWRRGSGAAPGALDALTEREVRVAGLVASGATNPEIADILFLSRKTIERDVSSILRKLEVRNRAELAGRMGDPAPRG